MITIQELQAKKEGLLAQAKAIQDVADNEKRDLTAEESASVDTCFAAFDATEKEIERRAGMEARTARVEQVLPRKVLPEGDVTEPPQAGASTSTKPPARGPITGGDVAGGKKGYGGFRGAGDYALAVKSAFLNGHSTADHRLKILNAATSYGAEGVGGDGGYLVPPDFRTTIMEQVAGEDSLLGYCDQQTTSSNSISVPVDTTTPWQTSGGVLAFWAAEGATATQSKPSLKNVTVRAEKLIALVPVTDELLTDAPALESYLRMKAPQKLAYKVNDAILNGDGVGKPAGILQSPALVSQAAEGGQTAATVNYANVTKMWSRMPQPNRRNAVWIINQDIEPQLFAMVVTGGSPALPAYLPPGGLSDKPYGMLMGRPVVYTEAAAAVGTVGDISFVDLKQYFALVKGGGVQTDVSIHLYFDQDTTAFRFVLRVGGIPWWPNSITRAKSALPMSAYVALAAR